jgi:zinc transport system substrate-binding protein
MMLALLVAIASACEGAGGRSLERPVVVVSVPPQAYFVRRLADDLVDVEVMVPPGASPHTYEPTMLQMRGVERASIYVKIGHPHFTFEKAWLNRLLETRADVTVVDCSADLPSQAEDPHVWVSPKAVRSMSPRIAQALIGRLPQERSRIEAAAADFLRDIDKLDAEIRGALAGVTKRRFYVYHPAWGYFAEEYGLDQVSIEIGAKEPDPRRIAEIIDRARSEAVRVIFVQPQFSRRSAEIIAAEIGGRVVPIDPLAYDWLSNLRSVAKAFGEALGKG